jgi:nucleoside-diphosphate-sugar epimerase
MTTLVVGAGGLIGAALVAALPSDDVVAAIRPGVRSELGPAMLQLDLSRPINPGDVPDAVRRVVFLAQSRLHREFPSGARDMFAVNVRAVHDLLAIAADRKWEHAVVASTGGVYAPSPTALSEEAPLAPPNFYARTRLAAETLALGYAELMPVAIVRPFFVYGPGQGHDMLVPRLYESVQTGTPIRITGEDGIAINPTYVDDAVDSIRALLETSASGVFNLAGPSPVTLREVATLLGEASGTEPVFEQVAGDDTPLVAATDALAAATGFRPSITPADGLARYAASRQQH